MGNAAFVFDYYQHIFGMNKFYAIQFSLQFNVHFIYVTLIECGVAARIAKDIDDFFPLFWVAFGRSRWFIFVQEKKTSFSFSSLTTEFWIAAGKRKSKQKIQSFRHFYCYLQFTAFVDGNFTSLFLFLF